MNKMYSQQVKNRENQQVPSMDITKRVRAEEKLRFLSFHDSQTGLYNRAYFFEEMERLESSRHFPVSIITCVLEKLKQINETLGRDTGNRVINAAVKILATNMFRKEDLIVRTGENAFAIILTKVGGEEIFSIRARMQKTIADFNEHGENDGIYRPISISCGFVTVRQGESIFDGYQHVNRLWSMK